VNATGGRAMHRGFFDVVGSGGLRASGSGVSATGGRAMSGDEMVRHFLVHRGFFVVVSDAGRAARGNTGAFLLALTFGTSGFGWSDCTQ